MQMTEYLPSVLDLTVNYHTGGVDILNVHHHMLGCENTDDDQRHRCARIELVGEELHIHHTDCPTSGVTAITTMIETFSYLHQPQLPWEDA